MNELMNLQIRSRCSSESNICGSSAPREKNQKQMLPNGGKRKCLSVLVDVEEVHLHHEQDVTTAQHTHTHTDHKYMILAKLDTV